ncbi:MAG TPA: hypothetical protein VIY52_01560, partial [Streptosporangiaceae bacterium]
WAAVAAPVGGGFHNFGVILLVLVVLGGLGFGVTRLRRGRPAAPHDDRQIRQEPPAPPPQAAPPPSEPPGGTAIVPARRPHATDSSERPPGG